MVRNYGGSDQSGPFIYNYLIHEYSEDEYLMINGRSRLIWTTIKS